MSDFVILGGREGVSGSSELAMPCKYTDAMYKFMSLTAHQFQCQAQASSALLSCWPSP